LGNIFEVASMDFHLNSPPSKEKEKLKYKKTKEIYPLILL